MLPENCQSSSKNVLKLQDIKFTYRNLLDFYTITTEDKKKKSRKKSYFQFQKQKT